MSDQLKESLSAAMDDEADEFELRRVLDEACQDAGLEALWQRYHLVRGVLQDRRYRAGSDTEHMMSNMWRRIDAGEALDEVQRVPGVPSWTGRVAAVAVAATVAVGVIVGADLMRHDEAIGEPQVAVVDRSDLIPAASTADPTLEHFPSRVDMQRTRAYMLHHAQHTSMYNQAGVVPFVKVVAFQGQ